MASLRPVPTKEDWIGTVADTVEMIETNLRDHTVLSYMPKFQPESWELEYEGLLNLAAFLCNRFWPNESWSEYRKVTLIVIPAKISANLLSFTNITNAGKSSCYPVKKQAGRGIGRLLDRVNR